MIEEFDFNTTIVTNDAGAANHIIAWINESNLCNFRIYAKGPSIQLWLIKFPKITLYNNISKALSGSNKLIAGTGWASDEEFNSIKLAKQKNIYSIAVIDHWTNYESRFIRDGEKILPNEIWVTDNYALDLAKKIFNKIPVHLKPNHYLENLTSEIKNKEIKPRSESTNILYLAEPILSAKNNDEIGLEFIALNFFMQNVNSLPINDKCVIKLRPHPSEKNDKYLEFEKKFKDLIQIDIENSLAELITWSDIVIGYQTYALVVAFFSNKITYLCDPDLIPASNLPFPEINRLSSLINK